MPATEYAVIGICTTPLILTIQLLVVCVDPKVKATVDPSPKNCSLVITVNAGTPTAVQALLSYSSRVLLVVLKRTIPVTPVAGRCAVFPTGARIELVELNATIALTVCVALPKLAVPVAAST